MTPFDAALAIVGLGLIALTLWMLAGTVCRLSRAVGRQAARVEQLEADVAILARRRPVTERTGR